MLADLLEKIGREGGTGKPVVGVSACLLGRAVRYNGETKYHAPTAEALHPWVELREYCPEVGIGLPVPRPPIQVVQLDDGQRVRGVEDREQEYTRELRDYADAIPPGLDGFVLKARSPSCGLDSTPLMDEADREIGVTSGAFADQLRTRRRWLPLCDEESLVSESGRTGFLLQVWLYHQSREGDGEPRPAELRALAEKLPSPAQAFLADWLSRAD